MILKWDLFPVQADPEIWFLVTFIGWMQIQMENVEGLAQEQIDDLLGATAGITFTAQGRREVYDWIVPTLVEQEYFSLRKKQRGSILALLSNLTGLSMSPRSATGDSE